MDEPVETRTYWLSWWATFWWVLLMQGLLAVLFHAPLWGLVPCAVLDGGIGWLAIPRDTRRRLLRKWRRALELGVLAWKLQAERERVEAAQREPQTPALVRFAGDLWDGLVLLFGVMWDMVTFPLRAFLGLLSGPTWDDMERQMRHTIGNRLVREYQEHQQEVQRLKDEQFARMYAPWLLEEPAMNEARPLVMLDLGDVSPQALKEYRQRFNQQIADAGAAMGISFTEAAHRLTLAMGGLGAEDAEQVQAHILQGLEVDLLDVMPLLEQLEQEEPKDE